MLTERSWVELLLVALLFAGPAQGLGLVGYDDPVRDSRVYHGVAHQETEDRWEPSPCFTAIVDHTLTLAVPRTVGDAGLEARLAIHADHLGGDPGLQTVSAVAEPGDPAAVEVTSPCTSPQFTVEALSVDVVTNYTVECTEGCAAPGGPLG